MVGRGRAGQAIVEEVAGLEENRRTSEQVRLVFPEPQEFAGRVIRVRRDAGVTMQERLAELLAEPCGLRPTAAIHPDDAARERLPVTTDRDDALALG
jgi:hypothetical protein